MKQSYEAIVIGAGHAGCEAALALARKGHRTLLLTISLDAVAFWRAIHQSAAQQKVNLSVKSTR